MSAEPFDLEDGITFEVYNIREQLGERAPDKNMIGVRVWGNQPGEQGAWFTIDFDKELAMQFAEKLGELAATL